jgi:hypothetical protein
MDGRIVVPKPRFAVAATVGWCEGFAADAQESIGLLTDRRSKPLSTPTELMMNDAKYLVYLGLSLTAFMSSALFLLVMLNPKDTAYSNLPVIYAVFSFAVGIVANLLAKKAERPATVEVVEHRRPVKNS